MMDANLTHVSVSRRLKPRLLTKTPPSWGCLEPHEGGVLVDCQGFSRQAKITA